MEPYKTIASDGMIEIEMKKSRFLCYLKRVTTEEEARNYLASLKKEHYKANHNCSAFIIGEKGQIKRSSDDGEPSGTAGVPILTVLEQHDLTNVLAVVTRYFGGIKLGAGGLIRAYAGSVAQAIKEIGVVTVKELEGLQIHLSYAQYQEFSHWCQLKGLSEVNPTFLETVTTTLYLEKEDIEPTTAELIELFHGAVSFEKSGTQIVEVPLV